MTQIARPVVIISGAGWTGVVGNINEADRDDSTFIRSAIAPNGTQPLVARLAPFEVPDGNDDHQVEYAIRKNQAGGHQLDMLVELVEGPLGSGETVIDSWDHTDLEAGAELFTRAIGSGDAGDIDDDQYAIGLYLRFTPTQIVSGATPPTVVSVDEDVIPVGRALTITCTDAVEGDTTVLFGSTEVDAGEVTYNLSTEVECDVPALTPGVYQVRIRTPDGTSVEVVQITVPTLVRTEIGSYDLVTNGSLNQTSYPQVSNEDPLPGNARVIAWVLSADGTDPVNPSAAGWGRTWTVRETISRQIDANWGRLTLLDTTTDSDGDTADELTVTFADAQTGAMIRVAAWAFDPPCPFVPDRRQVVEDTSSGVGSNSPTLDTLAALGPNAGVEAAFMIGRAAPALTPQAGWTDVIGGGGEGFTGPARGWAIVEAINGTDNTPGGTWGAAAWEAIAVEVG